MNKLYAFMFLEASSCLNGLILGTKWNASLCWKHSAVKRSEKSLQDPAELQQK